VSRGERPVELYGPGSDGSATGFGRVTHRLRQLPRVAERAVRHPGWLVETVRGVARRRRSARLPFRLAEHAHRFVAPADAVARATGASVDDAAAALECAWTPLDAVQGGHPLWGARRDLAQITAAVVALVRPSVVVETGVAQGVTTASILRALPDGARLHSIDLPVLDVDADDFVGALVPDELRDRWTLHRGPSRTLLPDVLREHGPIDLFVHDADHSHAGQLEELRTVWPHVRGGGVVLMDDVGNPAAIEFAAEVGVDLWLVGDVTHTDALGVLRKPAG
jgi:predicted O-methyltransferase YrrM